MTGVPPLHPEYPVASRYYRTPLRPGRCRFCQTSHKFGVCPEYQEYVTWLANRTAIATAPPEVAG